MLSKNYRTAAVYGKAGDILDDMVRLKYDYHEMAVSTNSFDGKTRKRKDGYRSTKHSGKGTGLASIAAAAEKYGGSAQASDSGTEFYVDVMLKI